MEDLIRQRGACKAIVTKFRTFLDTVDSSKVSRSFIETKISQLNKTFAKYDELQFEISLNDPQQESDRETFETTFGNVLFDAENLLLLIEEHEISLKSTKGLNSTSHVLNNVSYVNPNQFVLPKIVIGKFRGDTESWPCFKELYTSLILENEQISLIQKHFYLRSYLEGKAAKLLDSTPITEKDFEAAWEILLNKYDQPKIALKSQIKILFNLESVKFENPKSLEKLLDSSMQAVKALESRGQQIEHWDLILVELLLSKLDSKTVRAWETQTSEEDNPSFNDLCKFLQNRVNILSSLQTHERSKPPPNKNWQLSKPKAFTVSKPTSTNVSSPRRPSSPSSPKCHLCHLDHKIYICPKYKSMSLLDRKNYIKTSKRCFNCLSPTHLFHQCASTNRCYSCGEKHHTTLHNDKGRTSERNSSQIENQSNEIPVQPETQTCLHSSDSRGASQVLLSTCLVKVQNNQGRWIVVRALLDSAASHDFITSSLVKELNIPATSAKVTISGVDERRTSTLGLAKVNLRDNLRGNFSLHLNCLVINQIGANIPSTSFCSENWKFPSNLLLADPSFSVSSRVNLLLSADTFWKVFVGGKVEVTRGVFARETKLGWILTGKFSHIPTSSYSNCFVTNAELDKKLEKFWENELVCPSKDSVPSQEDNFCEELFQSSTSRDDDGRFIVKMPSIQGGDPSVNTKAKVMKQFYSMESRMKVDPVLKVQYSTFMAEYENLGHMKRVNSHSSFLPEIFLSHHAVWKDSVLKDKIRVVFNASLADENKISLNDFLLSGPPLQQNIVNILLNFRLHKIAVTADIQKFYRQISLHPSQRHWQRIFWRNSPTESLKVFELCSLTYGMKPCSYLAIRTLLELASQDGHLYHPSAALAIQRNMFVDDYLQSFSSLEEAEVTTSNLTQLLKGGCFPLVKWCSNSKSFLESISSPLRHFQPSDMSPQHCVKTLGLIWNPSSDTFHFTYLQRKPMVYTKRNILSVIASIFDPSNLIAPVTIIAKIMMQELWLLKCDWDDKVPENFKMSWMTFERNLLDISQIIIPRQICAKTVLVNPDLHIFADASEKAFGCCAYLVNSSNNELQSSLICSKAKVAPLKKITLPRLELCAAVVAAQLKTHIIEALHVPVKNVFLWSDSKITIAWLNQPPQKWNTFVANRVQTIQNLSSPNEWSYVKGNSNPADVVSRGSSPLQLANNSLYWNGPEWLTKDKSSWPNLKFDFPDEIPEERKTKNVMIISKTPNFFEDFSNFSKLTRVSAYMLRWKSRVLDKTQFSSPLLSLDEVKGAETKILVQTQRSSFSDDYKNLTSETALKRSSELFMLNPYLDDQGLIRVGGRLASANYPLDKRNPILLPYKNHVTNLIIDKYHLHYLHVGQRSLLYLLRERFWPIKAAKSINSIVRNCITCFKQRPKPSTQIMGDLPSCRTSPQRPFNCTGIDYTGSFLLKNPAAKAYVILFICMTTGAIHLELVSNANTAFFLSALERFIFRRGIPEDIYSDNGTNLTKAQRILTASMRKDNNTKMRNFCCEHKIVWHHIPPYSPTMGGRWEAQMRILKKHLRSSTKDIALPYEHFNSLLVKIEGIMNSRPLTSLSPSTNDLLPLTPSHFLIGQSMSTLPSPSLVNKELNLIDNLKLLKARVNMFWKRWQKEYLSHLQQRSKWNISSPNVKVGELVLMKESSPFMIWKLARVIKTFEGSDRRVRVVELKTEKGITKRHITKVCPLPHQVYGREE